MFSFVIITTYAELIALLRIRINLFFSCHFCTTQNTYSMKHNFRVTSKNNPLYKRVQSFELKSYICILQTYTS